MDDIQARCENTRVSMYEQETGANIDYAGWETSASATNMPISIVPSRVEDRIGGSGEYDERITDVGYCDDPEEVFDRDQKIVVTHRKDEFDRWTKVSPTDREESYIILAVNRTPGMPVPITQRRLHLWRERAV